MRTFSRILVFLVIVSLGALPVAAQDNLTETYSSADGSLSFNYPAGWVAWGYGNDFGEVANSEAAHQVINANGQLASGSVGISVTAVLFASPDEVVTAEEMAASMQAAFGDTAGDFGAQYGITVELINPPAFVAELDSAVEMTYQRTGTGFSEEIYNIEMISGSTGLLEINATAPNGETAQYRDLVIALAASIQFRAPAADGQVIPGTGAAAVPGSGNIDWRQSRLQGSAADNFQGLGSLSITADGLIFVADDSAGVRVLDANGSLLYTIANHAISSFDDVAVAVDGTLWVADSFQSKVFHLDAQGNRLSEFGEMGNEPGQFSEFSPQQIEIGPDGNLYLDNNRQIDYSAASYITVYAPDGTFVREFPTDPNGEYLLYGHLFLAAAPDGTLYVGDLYTTEVRGFAPDGTSTRRGVGAGVLMGAQQLAAGPDGDLYVAASFMGSIIYQFDSNGNLLTQYDVTSELSFITGLGVLPDGAIIVAGPAAAPGESAVIRLTPG